MDEFFQKLRKIQERERNQSGLTKVGDSFYQDVAQYLNVLMKKIDDNPFSFESYLLRDAQRIVAEICERREHKITNRAVLNVQRSHQLFNLDKKNNQRVPNKATPEERKLYLSLVKSLIDYREEISEPLHDYSKKTADLQTESDKIEEPKTQIEYSGKDDEAHAIGKTSYDDIKEIFGQEPPQEKSDKIIASHQSTSHKNSATTNQDKRRSNSKLEVILVLDELPSIMGVDQMIYGPISPQDIITMPQPNANILIKKQKGRLIPYKKV